MDGISFMDDIDTEWFYEIMFGVSEILWKAVGYIGS